MRIGKLNRETAETKIICKLNLDGTGKYEINTGVGFFDHMLSLFSKHSNFDLNLSCEGDLEIDNHHSIEDIGIVMGICLKEALGEKKSIKRYGNFYCPMDEALSRITVDMSGRGYLVYNVDLTRDTIGDFESDGLKEFLYSFAINSGINLHITNLYGENNHHIVESIFKGIGRALKEACTIDESIIGIPSTKGSL